VKKMDRLIGNKYGINKKTALVIVQAPIF